ncbi:MAG: CBS domain-containing protein [Thermoproteota archaeon]|jgi:CBS domain-containing protein|nr:CBS domain-containing protein [Thermoproteota archaeon]
MMGRGIDSAPVSNFMTTELITATEDQTIQQICKMMSEHDIGSVIVVKRSVDGNNPIGIITERDIVNQIGSAELFLVQKPIREIMSYPLVTVDLTTSIREAVEIMQSKNIRRLLVVDKESKARGILTQKDVFKALSPPSY